MSSHKLGDPIFTDRVAGSKEDQALVEKLIGRGYAGHNARAVSPVKPTAAQLRAERVAARFGKQIVWVEGLNTAGLTFRGLDRGVIYLDPDSGRSAQVLTVLQARLYPGVCIVDGLWELTLSNNSKTVISKELAMTSIALSVGLALPFSMRLRYV